MCQFILAPLNQAFKLAINWKHVGHNFFYFFYKRQMDVYG